MATTAKLILVVLVLLWFRRISLQAVHNYYLSVYDLEFAEVNFNLQKHGIVYRYFFLQDKTTVKKKKDNTTANQSYVVYIILKYCLYLQSVTRGLKY